jgi:hypothetical protein
LSDEAFPLRGEHTEAPPAAETARCASEETGRIAKLLLKEKPIACESLLWQRRWHGDSRDGGLIVAGFYITALF